VCGGWGGCCVRGGGGGGGGGGGEKQFRLLPLSSPDVTFGNVFL